MNPEEAKPALARWLIGALGAGSVQVQRLERLGGGAIQENWALDAVIGGGAHHGRLAAVVRTDAKTRIAASHDRIGEYKLLAAAHRADVRVAEPLALCPNSDVLGAPFFVMRRLAGTAAGHILIRDDKWRGDRVALAEELGRQLARIHAIVPPRDELIFLGAPPDSPALALVATMRRWLDDLGTARPALEWGLRWLERHAPRPAAIVLAHRDFRTGNYLVDENGLVGILDWEFAGWSDPHEDIGWFCAACWRFGADTREAGGIGAREDFYRGYESESAHRIDRDAVAYWETMAHARWAVVALQQGARHVAGGEFSLDLALTGRRVAAIEHDLLERTRT
jgi:aminoglycoside phosphotransferase (APT) family kinase protein